MLVQHVFLLPWFILNTARVHQSGTCVFHCMIRCIFYVNGVAMYLMKQGVDNIIVYVN